jgi:hypothetical protein
MSGHAIHLPTRQTTPKSVPSGCDPRVGLQSEPSEGATGCGTLARHTPRGDLSRKRERCVNTLALPA